VVQSFKHFRLTDDPRDISLHEVHCLLRASYWAPNRNESVQAQAMAHSLNVAALENDRLVAYARVVTDRATFAWLCDVIVAPEYRGQGLGQALLRFLDAHPGLQGLRRWLLATRDAHELYARFGWQPLDRPAVWMERFRPDSAMQTAEPTHD